MGHLGADVCLRLRERLRNPYADECASGMRSLAVGARLRASRGSLLGVAGRTPCRRALATMCLSWSFGAPFQAGPQGRHEVDHVSSRRGPRLGDGDLPTLHLTLDRLLDPRLDLIGIGARIEALGALLLDELAGQLELRFPHP